MFYVNIPSASYCSYLDRGFVGVVVVLHLNDADDVCVEGDCTSRDLRQLVFPLLFGLGSAGSQCREVIQHVEAGEAPVSRCRKYVETVRLEKISHLLTRTHAGYHWNIYGDGVY